MKRGSVASVTMKVDDDPNITRVLDELRKWRKLAHPWLTTDMVAELTGISSRKASTALKLLVERHLAEREVLVDALNDARGIVRYRAR